MISTLFDWQHNNQKKEKYYMGFLCHISYCLSVILMECFLSPVVGSSCNHWSWNDIQCTATDTVTLLMSFTRDAVLEKLFMFLKSDQKLFDRNLQFLINILFVPRAFGSDVSACVCDILSPASLRAFICC